MFMSIFAPVVYIYRAVFLFRVYRLSLLFAYFITFNVYLPDIRFDKTCLINIIFALCYLLGVIQ